MGQPVRIQGVTTKIFKLALMVNLLSFLKGMDINIAVHSECQWIGPHYKLGKKILASIGLKIQGGYKYSVYFVAKMGFLYHT